MAPKNTPLDPVELNGQPAMLVFFEGETLTNAFLLDVTDDGLTAIYVVRNPDKLRRLAATATLPQRLRPRRK